jgi:hypothetical protein
MNNSAYFQDPVPYVEDTGDTSYAEAIVVDLKAPPLSKPKQNGLSYGKCFLREPTIGVRESEFQIQLAADERFAGVR